MHNWTYMQLSLGEKNQQEYIKNNRDGYLSRLQFSNQKKVLLIFSRMIMNEIDPEQLEWFEYYF